MTASASASYTRAVKRVPIAVVPVVAGMLVAGSSAAIQTRLTHAQAVTRLGGLLGAKPLLSLTPLRERPTIGRVEAISKLRSWGHPKGRLQGVWLVRFRHREGRERLAWMAVTLHARVPILGCSPGKTCKRSYTSPLASFLDARSGKFVEAVTINGWKPRLP